MHDLKNNYNKEEEQLLCPICEIEEDARAYVLKSGRD